MNTIEELSLYVAKVQPVIGWPEWEDRFGRKFRLATSDNVVQWEVDRESSEHEALCLWREHCREQWSRRGFVVFEDYQDPDLRARQYVAYGPGAVLIGTFGTLAEANVAIAVMVAVWRLEHTE